MMCRRRRRQLPLDIRWHFIGTLQSNKAKTLACTFVSLLLKLNERVHL